MTNNSLEERSELQVKREKAERTMMSMIKAAPFVIPAWIALVFGVMGIQYCRAADIADSNGDGKTTASEWREAYERSNQPYDSQSINFFRISQNNTIIDTYNSNKF